MPSNTAVHYRSLLVEAKNRKGLNKDWMLSWQVHPPVLSDTMTYTLMRSLAYYLLKWYSREGHAALSPFPVVLP